MTCCILVDFPAHVLMTPEGHTKIIQCLNPQTMSSNGKPCDQMASLPWMDFTARMSSYAGTRNGHRMTTLKKKQYFDCILLFLNGFIIMRSVKIYQIPQTDRNCPSPVQPLTFSQFDRFLMIKPSSISSFDEPHMAFLMRKVMINHWILGELPQNSQTKNYHHAVGKLSVAPLLRFYPG